jgi:hypothetical protein
MHLQHLSAYCTYCVLWASVFSVQEAAVRRWETWTTSRTRHQHVTSLSSWLLSLSLVGNYWRASTCNFPGLVTAYCNKGGASNNIAIVQHLHNRSISNTIAIYCSCNILLPGYALASSRDDLQTDRVHPTYHPRKTWFRLYWRENNSGMPKNNLFAPRHVQAWVISYYPIW